jgi:hypothetical protein
MDFKFALIAIKETTAYGGFFDLVFRTNLLICTMKRTASRLIIDLSMFLEFESS